LSTNICVGIISGMDKPKRPRGRPPLPAKERGTKQVHFRCTAAEKASYRRKAGAKGISAWLKKLADDA
jgi:hypothetical protein